MNMHSFITTIELKKFLPAENYLEVYSVLPKLMELHDGTKPSI